MEGARPSHSFRQRLEGTPVLRRSKWTLSGCRSLCRGVSVQDCHADVLISDFKRQLPSAYDRSMVEQAPPGRKVMSFLAELRREPESDEGSTADEGALPRGPGSGEVEPPCRSDSATRPATFPTGSRWRHRVGGNLKIEKNPETERWKGVAELFRKYAEAYNSAQLK